MTWEQNVLALTIDPLSGSVPLSEYVAQQLVSKGWDGCYDEQTRKLTFQSSDGSLRRVIGCQNGIIEQAPQLQPSVSFASDSDSDE